MLRIKGRKQLNSGSTQKPGSILVKTARPQHVTRSCDEGKIQDNGQYFSWYFFVFDSAMQQDEQERQTHKETLFLVTSIFGAKIREFVLSARRRTSLSSTQKVLIPHTCILPLIISAIRR